MEALFDRHAIGGGISLQLLAGVLGLIHWTRHVLQVLDVPIVWHFLHVLSTEAE